MARLHPVKVMSFNLAGCQEGVPAVRRWDVRAPVCIDIIRRCDPAIIGFQEIQPENRLTLEAGFPHYACEYGDLVLAERNPIYWNSECFEKLAAGGFYLSLTPDQLSKSWDAVSVRGAVWVKLRSKQTNAELMCVNVHLDHRGCQARIESSQLIVEQIRQLRHTLPVIVTGDFNSRAWAPASENVYDYPPPVMPNYLPEGGVVHRIYTERNFKDSYLEAGWNNHLAMNTYHDYAGDGFPPVALRLDWILLLNGVQHIRTLSHMIVYDAYPPIYASDHYPVLAELALR